MHQYIYEIFPGTIQLVGNHVVSNQLIGLQCLKLILNHKNQHTQDLNCLNILKTNGYDKLILTKLKTLINQPDEQILEILLENLYILLSEYDSSTNHSNLLKLSSKNLIVTLEIDNEIDDIFFKLILNLAYNQNNVNLIQKYLIGIRIYFFPLLGCNLIKFTNIFLKNMDILLDISYISHQYELIELCLKTINDFMVIVNVQFSIDETKLLLNHLFKVIIKLKFDKTNNHETITNEVYELLTMLEQSSCQSVNIAVERFSTEMIKCDLVWKEISNHKQLIDFIQRNNNQ